ncbi:hypothetical protein FAUST_1221 [Fusarium austroamericanum]|uniref:Uncharacterized protein n=1 Tax=Fusarium austroamericanum TaxID=282268 RepID=A0AAN6HJR5_FUSAU|nr:hypothetical protein FAUST_1221 [Fusarium austroamericanum]
MKRNVLAVMAIVNGLAQANRFSWQSEAETDVAKHGHDYEHKSNDVYKAKEDPQSVESLDDDWDDEKEEEKKQSELDYEKLKLLKEKLRAEKEKSEVKEKEKEYEHDKNKHHDYNSDPKSHKTYDHYKPTITGHHKHHGDHYDVYDYKKPIIVDGKKYDYVHKPITKHHTYTKIHEPEVKPGCYGDRCDRKPCNKCGDNWAQPGCWHCKSHEGESEVTKTTKYAPEKTDDKYQGAKTYTHKGVTVIVPKETKAPEAPKIEKPKEQPKKEEKYEDICRKVTKGHGEHKHEETICDRVKHHKGEHHKGEHHKGEHHKGEHHKVYVEPKKEEKYEDICRKVTKGHGEHKYEETVCDRIKHHKEEKPKKEHKYEDICRKVTKGHGEHKHEETICDRVKYQKEEHPKVYVEPKKEDICDKIKGCPARAPAPQPHYPKVEPVPAPAPQPYYPKKEDICDKIKGCPAPASAPAPAPHYPKLEPGPIPAPRPKPEEIKPVPVPAPVPVNPEQISPEGKGSEEAPRVPLTVSKSGANFNTISIAGTIVVGIVGVMLL